MCVCPYRDSARVCNWVFVCFGLLATRSAMVDRARRVAKVVGDNVVVTYFEVSLTSPTAEKTFLAVGGCSGDAQLHCADQKAAKSASTWQLPLG